MKTFSRLAVLLLSAGCGVQLAGPPLTTVLERPPPGFTQDRPTRPCFGGPNSDGKVLAAAVGPIVSLVREDASSQRILALEPIGSVSTTDLYVGSVQARDEHLALSFSIMGGTRSQALLLDASGVQQWEAFNPFVKVHLGERGHLAANLRTSLELFNPSGGATTIQGVVAMSEPGVDGTVAVESTVAPGGFGWIYGGSGPMHPLAFPVSNTSRPRWTQAGFVYLSNQDARVVLVAEQAGKSPRVVALPSGSQGFELKHVSAAGRVVVGPRFVTPQNVTSLLQVDLEAAVTTTLRQDFPAGMRFFKRNRDYLEVFFADDGSVLLALRGEYAGGLFRSEDFGRSWNLVGAPITGITGVEVTERAGTYLVKGSTSSSGFYSFEAVSEEWAAPPPGIEPLLVGNGELQLVRPAENLSKVFADSQDEHWATSLSHDGLCAARWTQKDGPLVFQLVDLVGGDSTPVNLESAPHPEGTYFGVTLDWYR